MLLLRRITTSPHRTTWRTLHAPTRRSLAHAAAAAGSIEDASLFRLDQMLDPWDSLGLTLGSLVQNPSAQTSLLQLPEIRTFLEEQQQQQQQQQEQQQHTADAVPLLERGLDIFAAIQPNGPEQHTLLALLAETKCHLGDYAGAVEVLSQLPHNTTVEQAKCWWLQGDLEKSQALLKDEQSSTSTSNQQSVAVGLALCRLMAVQTADDVFSMRDPFRAMVQSTKKSRNPVAHAAALLNYGVAETVYAQVLQKERGLEELPPLDAALKSWKEGLSHLQRLRKTNQNTRMVPALSVRLHANMAWGLLQMGHVKEASAAASSSLKLYDATWVCPDSCCCTGVVLGGMSRTLALVAQCYHQSGAAVTAEGLYQSAVAKPAHNHNSPLEWLNHREALVGYARLLSDWEKRERDAERYQAAADADAEEFLPGAWKTKSGIHSSLWFWLPTQVV